MKNAIIPIILFAISNAYAEKIPNTICIKHKNSQECRHMTSEIITEDTNGNLIKH